MEKSIKTPMTYTASSWRNNLRPKPKKRPITAIKNKEKILSMDLYHFTNLYYVWHQSNFSSSGIYLSKNFTNFTKDKKTEAKYDTQLKKLCRTFCMSKSDHQALLDLTKYDYISSHFMEGWTWRHLPIGSINLKLYEILIMIEK